MYDRLAQHPTVTRCRWLASAAPRNTEGALAGKFVVKNATTPEGEMASSASTIEIIVDGVRWTEVDSLAHAGPYDRVYVVEESGDGGATLHFGDGVRGAVPPVGSVLRADYRYGGGRAGNIGASALGVGAGFLLLILWRRCRRPDDVRGARGYAELLDEALAARARLVAAEGAGSADDPATRRSFSSGRHLGVHDLEQEQGYLRGRDRHRRPDRASQWLLIGSLLLASVAIRRCMRRQDNCGGQASKALTFEWSWTGDGQEMILPRCPPR
jgi:hypothetical protein